MTVRVAAPASGGNAFVANGACFLGIFLWSVGFPAGEVLLETWGGIALSFGRMAIGGSLLLAAWAALDGTRAVASAPWRRAVRIGGIGFGVGTMLLFVGQDYSDAVIPAVAIAMMPVAGAIIEIVLEKRRLRAHVAAGIGLALVGGYLATGVRLADGTFGLGAVLCLIAVFLFAWGTRATTRDLPGLSATGQTAITLTGAVAVIGVVVAAGMTIGLPDAEIGDTGLRSVGLLLIVAVPSLAVAQLLWIWAAGRLGILLASLHMNAMPFYVMVIVVLAFEEPWQWQQALGALLVAAGVVCAQVRPRRLE